MQTTTEPRAVTRELTIAAAPETVWALLTDPAEAVRWMGVAASFDLRPGGEYRVEVIPGRTAVGAFVEIDPPRRLVTTWGWEQGDDRVPPGSTTVEFELVPDGDGTLLRFAHRDLPGEEAAASHGYGWRHYLARLAILGDGGEPGRDGWAQPSPALRVALEYFEAWASKDLETALGFVADDVVCDAPVGKIEGVEAYRAFMAPFVESLETASLIAAFGDEETAVVVYDTRTKPVPSAPGAEAVVVRDGKIARSRFVFDRLPFREVRP